jgi:hypothetical protein
MHAAGYKFKYMGNLYRNMRNVGLILGKILKIGHLNILKGKQSSKWRGMSPVSVENIALFIPA